MFDDFSADDELLLKTLPIAKKSGPGRSWGTSEKDKSFCGVINCSSCTLSCPDLWFFKLPVQSPERREEWLKQIGRPDIQPFYRVLVCEKHFKPSDIKGTSTSTRRYVKPGARPTLFLPTLYEKQVSQRNNSDIKVYKRTKTTTKSDVEPNISIKVESYDMNDDNNHNITEDFSHLSSVSSSMGNKTIDSFISIYNKLKDKTEPSKIIYSGLKMFKLYIKNEQLYQLLQSTLGLPPVSILPSYIPSTIVGKNEVYVSSLKGKISAKPLKHKYGILCMTLMKIQPYVGYDYELDKLSGVCEGINVAPIQYAVVAMVRGITDDWYHVASIYFIAALNAFTEFNVWLEKLINTLNEIGINVKAIATSTDDFFMNALEILKPNYKKKYIYCIFDPLHIMLLLYDELKNKTVCFSQSQQRKKIVANWKHISKFYEQDSTRDFRLTHRSGHINPDDLQLNKLKAAAQTLSLSTATGMSTFVDLGLLDKKAMDTVDFILRINRIFAALYPSAFQPEDKHLLSQEGDNLWNNGIEFLTSIKRTIDGAEETKVKFANCFKKNIISIELMKKSSSLKPFFSFISVLTHNLNLYPLMEFIHEINLKSFKHKHPTLHEFLEIIDNSFMQNNFHNMKSEVNDLECFIDNANEVIKQDCIKEVESQTFQPSRRLGLVDYTQIDHEDAGTILYVATYLLDKMYIKYETTVSSIMIFMSSSVHYENRRVGRAGICGSLIIPNNDFLEFVHNMDMVFVDYCKKAMATGNFRAELLKQMDKLIVRGPIDRKPLEYVKDLFIDLRIYHTIKSNNNVYEKDYEDSQEFVVKRLSN